MDDARAGRYAGGWLLLLCMLLLVWQPISLGLTAAGALQALPLRGVPLALVLAARLLVTGFGIGAALAVLGRRPAGIPMLRASLVLSAGIDVFVYTTPYFPNNRMPGDTPYYVAASLLYYGAWLLYLARSNRVRELERSAG